MNHTSPKTFPSYKQCFFGILGATVSILFIVPTNAYAQIPYCAWAGKLSGQADVASNDIATDAMGTSFVVGSFMGTVDFDPSPNGSSILNSNGGKDMFVAKYDDNGAYQWAIQVGGGLDDEAYSIAYTVDASESIYVTGYFQGTDVDFDPSSSITTLSSNGGKDIFIAKYNSNGSFLWAFNIGSAEDDRGYGICASTSGVYVTGAFQGVTETTDFDPGSSTYFLQSNNWAEPYWDEAFIAKYDNSGNYQWAFSIGGTNHDAGGDVTVDTYGNVYVTGYFASYGYIDFDPGPSNSYHTWHGIGDMFLAKYDSDGQYQWANNVGGQPSSGGITAGLGIVTTTTNEEISVFVTGKCLSAKVDFDPGAELNYWYLEQGTRFLTKYNGDGTHEWAFRIKTGDTDISYGSIDADLNGNIYISGRFYVPIDINPLSAPYILNSSGASDGFVAKYGSDGRAEWAFSFGGQSDDVANAISSSTNAAIFTTGSFQSVADFASNGPSQILAAEDQSDAFVAKYFELITSNSEQESKSSATAWFSGSNIEYNTRGYNTPLRITLVDALGRQVTHQETTNTQGVIPTPESNGIYFLTISNANNYSTHKLLITH